MSKINTSISASAAGTYGLPNSLIGQIKTILQNDPNVSVVSDNEPDNETIRTLVYTVASQGHYAQIKTATATTIAFNTLKLDGSTILTSPTSLTVATGTAYAIRLLYNTKAHLFLVGGNVLLSTIYLNVGDTTNGWYIKPFGASSSSLACYNGSDATGVIKYPFYGGLSSSGGFIGIPIRFYFDGQISDYYNPYLYGTSTEILGSNSAGFYTSGGYNYLVLGAYYILSDQVPS